jgi:hypothetical protein
MSYENPWTFNNNVVDSEILENYIGFVYIITNLTNNKKYIGKKLLKKSKTRQVKGKKKRSLVESDWKEYYGSNKDLLVELNSECMAAGNFKREILRLCKTKGECTYYEAKAQFDADVLNKDDYYNGWIIAKVSRSHLPKN